MFQLLIETPSFEYESDEGKNIVRVIILETDSEGIRQVINIREIEVFSDKDIWRIAKLTCKDHSDMYFDDFVIVGDYNYGRAKKQEAKLFKAIKQKLEEKKE